MTYSKDLKNLLGISLPNLAENILQTLMGIVDSYLVAQVGLAAISGVSIANNIISVYQAIFIALGGAVSSLVAKSIGQKNHQAEMRYIKQSLTLTLLIGAALGLLSSVFASFLFDSLGTKGEIAHQGVMYLTIVGGGIVTLGLNTSLGAILRATGQVNYPMVISLLANGVNLILAWLALVVFQAGVFGVALATLLARLVCLAILAKRLDLNPRDFLWTGSFEPDLLGLLFPATGERLMMRLGDVVITALIISFGSQVVAGHAIGEVLIQFNYLPGMSVATATVILTAKAYGQKDRLHLKRIIKVSYVLAVALMVLSGGLTYLYAQELSALFTQDKIAIAASVLVITYSLIGIPITAGVLTYTSLYQGLGQAKYPFYATSIGMWVVRIGLGYILGHVMGLQLVGVWLATIADNTWRLFFLVFFYYKSSKQNIF